MKASFKAVLCLDESASLIGSEPSPCPIWDDDEGLNVVPGTSSWSATCASIAWVRKVSACRR